MISILPEKQVQQHIPRLNMLTYFPGRLEAENKQLMALNDRLAAENSRLARIVVFGIATAFLAGVVIGCMCKVGGVR